MDDLTGAPAAEAPVVETPVVETPAPAVPAPETPVTPETPKERREIIAEALNKPSTRGQHAKYQPRDQGKFAGAPQTPEIQRPPLLKSLKKELEPHWNQAPKELLDAFSQREADFEKGANEWKGKAAQAEAVLSEFQPYEWILRQEGSTPQAAIRPLLQTAALLRTGSPVQKAQAVAQMLQQFNIPLEHVGSFFGGQQIDPNMNALHHELSTLRQQVAQSQQQNQQAQEQRALTAIQQVAADPKNVHFNALQDKIMALLQAPHVLGPDFGSLSEKDKLQRAYDTAKRLDPTIAAQDLAQQQAETQRLEREKAQQAANVAKAAAVQVRGAPGAPLSPSVNPTDRRAVIANALRAH